MKSKKQNLFEHFRRTHPEFTYNRYSCDLIDNKLLVKFYFNIGEKYFFSPEHILPLPPGFEEKKLENSLFRNIIFNLGMVEAISYWKSACPPRVVINAGTLREEQLGFWKKLFLHGLGEFFYVNGIEPGDEPLHFVQNNGIVFQRALLPDDRSDGVLVPVGGGKDSVVTLEVLSRQHKCIPYIMNPREASIRSAQLAGYSESDVLSSERSIDPVIIDMNNKGFLNGHTPFSALLAFTAVLLACLHGYTEIALSNESSANEPSIPGTKINHQYSKSLEFENDFREYLAKYITADVNYYSFLRPLNELQIAGLFSKFPAHHESFRSCNAGSKTNSWCGNCPKCLFTFIVLSPFISHKRLVSIFGQDLLNDGSLIPLLDKLTGNAAEKPFDCVGTVNEVNLAMRYLVSVYGDADGLAVLLKYYRSQNMQFKTGLSKEFSEALAHFDEHNIPSPKDVNLLKSLLNDIRY